MTPADDKEIVKWQLKYLSDPDRRSEMKESDLEWSIKMEALFKNKGYLSPREMEILDNIYRKY